MSMLAKEALRAGGRRPADARRAPARYRTRTELLARQKVTDPMSPPISRPDWCKHLRKQDLQESGPRCPPTSLGDAQKVHIHNGASYTRSNSYGILGRCATAAERHNRRPRPACGHSGPPEGTPKTVLFAASCTRPRLCRVIGHGFSRGNTRLKNSLARFNGLFLLA